MLELTKNKIETILSNVNDTIFIIEFSANWCQPSNVMRDILRDLEYLFPDVEFYNCDNDKFYTFTKEMDIMFIPTILKIKNGQVIDKLEKLNSFDTIKEFIQNT